MCAGSSVSKITANPKKTRAALVALLAAALAGLAVLAVWPKFNEPVHWTLDGLFYQARTLELQGVDHDVAFARVFNGPISADLREEDPAHTGNTRWVEYNEPFYERRVSVPYAASVVYPIAEERSLLDVSLAGFVASIVALFGLLLMRFRIAIAAALAIATILLPPLALHSSYPITDSWGLALEITALLAALLALDRGLRWLPLWIGAIALLGFTRDSTWIPVLAVGWCALKYRSRVPVTLFATGLAAAIPALLLFTTPVRDLLAMLVNSSEPSADTSWSFIVSHYPRALFELVRANVGFLRRGEWYTAFYLVGGVVALLLLVWRGRARGYGATLMSGAAALGIVYVLAAPVFSAFRLELVFVPMAAYGLALTAELVASRVGERYAAVDRFLVAEPARAPRS